MKFEQVNNLFVETCACFRTRFMG